MMKNLAHALVIMVLLTACTTAAANSGNPDAEPALMGTGKPEELPTTPESSTPAPGPTDIFITQVMATKYAARTQYAAIPTLTATPTIPADSPACRPAELLASSAPGAGGQYVDIFINVTNSGDSACFLPAWPVVQLMDPSGKPLEVAYDYIQYNESPLSAPPSQPSNPGEPLEYGLNAGKTANFFLAWGDWCQGAVEGNVMVRISLLDKADHMDIPTEVGGGGHCDDPNSPSTVDVFGFEY